MKMNFVCLIRRKLKSFKFKFSGKKFFVHIMLISSHSTR